MRMKEEMPLLLNVTEKAFTRSMGEAGRKQKSGTVIFVQYTNPAAYPPLAHVSRILAGNHWQIMFLGTDVVGTDSLRFESHSSIEVRSMGFSAPGWRRKIHYLRFLLWTILWTLRTQPQIVYASDLLACPAGLIISYLPGTTVIYHEHDSPRTIARSVVLRFAYAARRRLSKRAAACILPNKRRADAFVKETANGNNVLCVWNCPSMAEIAPAREPSNGDEVWVLYQGSIVPSRLPLTVVEALALLPNKMKLRVIGYETIGHPGYVDELHRLAKRLGVLHRVQFLGPVPRSRLMELVATCDIGLSLMPNETDDFNQQAMIGASNKAFDYLTCGLPLLVRHLPDWLDAYVTTGYGHDCDHNDPRSIAGKLLWFANNGEEMRAMGERGRQKILAEWNYETQFSQVAAVLEDKRDKSF